MRKSNHDPDPVTNFSNLTAGLFHFVSSNLSSSLNALFMDWSMVIRHPMESSFRFIFAPLVAGFLVFFAFVLAVINKYYPYRLFPQDWWDPDQTAAFQAREAQVARGLQVLITNSVKETKMESGFDVDTASALLLFSSVMYHSDERRQAVLDPFPDMKLGYDVVPNSHLGQFCGLFTFPVTWRQKGSMQVSFSEEKKWPSIKPVMAEESIKTCAIVIAFRGTTPLNMNQWLLDCSINKVNASEYLSGNVHEGFYSTLFSVDRGCQHVSYEQIIEKIKITAEHNPDIDFQLWVTGHSLGAALASLFFARIRDSNDLSALKNVNICGAYTFGSPRVGNLFFRNHYTFRANNPIENTARMYRIQNANDVVPQVPFGFDSQALSGAGLDVLDYCHVGKSIYLHYHLLEWLPDRYPKYTVGTTNDLLHYYRASLLVWLRAVRVVDWFLGLKALLSTQKITTLSSLLFLPVEFVMQWSGVADHRTSNYLKNLDHYFPPTFHETCPL